MQRFSFVLACFLALTLQVYGQIPRTISYQGVLCDATGKPKPDAAYTLTFRLYDAESGGTLLWSEQKNLDTKRGLFSTQLGDQVIFSAAVKFDRRYWMSIQVGAEAELSPRVPLSSVGNSFYAAKADTAATAVGIKDSAVTSGKIASGQVVRSINALKDNVTLEGGSNVTISKNGNTLTIATASGPSGPWQTSGSDIYYNTGNVGIGTSSPASKLQVLDGSVLFSGTTGGTPASGVASRFMWIPAKSAFRAGFADGDQWDDPKIGWGSAATGEGTTASNVWSIATGFYTTASGRSSTAMGFYTTASDTAATSMGHHTQAIGIASTAMGYGTKATGKNSVAMGDNTTASAKSAVAMGGFTKASGDFSTAMGGGTTANSGFTTAMGYGTTASGEYSTAMGYGTTAGDGYYSTAMGFQTTASGQYAVAMGDNTTASSFASIAMGTVTLASGERSTAMGTHTTASGGFSTAMGSYVSTNGHKGAFITGDNSSSTIILNDHDNEFKTVFAGGYRLLTDRGLAAGVYMNGGTSGWTNISDRNKKENFRPIDGEQLLLKIRAMPIMEWNYKQSDPSIKYVGPVAQDFHTAFHLGGTDSLGINSICMDGVNMAAVQALEKRTAELREKTAELQARTLELEVVKSELADVKSRLARLEEALSLPKELTQRVSAETRR